MKKLVIDDAIPLFGIDLARYFDVTVLPGAKISRADLADKDALLVRTRTKCNRALLEGTPVKLAATATIGLDHFDIPVLEKMGIAWTNAPGCNAPAVAQYVWSALLHSGFDPRSQTLGVVGKGNVGSVVAAWGRKLGCRVIVCDPPRQERGLEDEDYLPLDRLMAEADAVTLHTPLIPEFQSAGDPNPHPTFHLINVSMLEKMKPGAILVNAARGGVVDEKALKRLKAEKGLKTVIDTWEGEPTIDPEMLEMADIATFHIAGYSRQGKERATRGVLEALNDTFGTTIPLEGLAPTYRLPESLTPERIMASYPIMEDDALMRRKYMDFEHLRDHYPLREEI